MNIHSHTSNPQFDFLMQMLQTIAESGDDTQKVYHLLVANTDKIDAKLAEKLQAWAIDKLAQVEPYEAQYIAGDIFDFSNFIAQFPLGDKANNIEIAITSYKIVLTIYTNETFPQEWAMTQNNLAVAYLKRIKGDKAENLEQAITCCQNALKVRTFDAFPYKWAGTQNNLGLVYHNRITEEPAQNLEQAIACFQNALKVYTFDSFSYEWAGTQNNLGIVYQNRIIGETTENLKQAITCFQNALKVYTFDNFPCEWAETQNNLAHAYFSRVKGERVENLEQVIKHYQKALKVYTHEAFPKLWALIQYELGNAYLERIQGDKSQNLELAIRCFKKTLQVYTYEAFPYIWGRAQDGLGRSYRNRIRGDIAQNLELAIKCFIKALQVYTREAFLNDWVSTQNNLGNAYLFRIQGDRTQNLELAIKCFIKALQVLNCNDFSKQWAMGQQNLGLAYINRVWGEKAQNLELAIECFIKALQVVNREAFSYEWATIQNNLGNAYLERIRGDRAHNLELAIEYYSKALEVYTSVPFSYERAKIQNCLGSAYLERIWGDRTQNIELAIEHYKKVLQVHTLELFQNDWAMAQNNLGNAYIERIQGNRTQNVELAIEHYKKALQVHTHEAFPHYWAMAQNNLGNAYIERIQGNRTQNVELAIEHYKKALQVHTREAFLYDWIKEQTNLGIAYQSVQQFFNAKTAFNAAIEVIEYMRTEIFFGSDRQEDKQKLAEGWNHAYQCKVEICLKLENFIEAIEAVEHSKTRNLVEQILNRDLKTIFPPEVVTQLEQYRDEIAAGQYKIQNGKAKNSTALAQYLQKLRLQRQKLQNRFLLIGSSFQFDKFRATLDNDTAIIEWYITENKILAFIIKPSPQIPVSSNEDADITVWQAQAEDLTMLIDWVNEYLQSYYEQKNEWQDQLELRLQKLAQILHIDEIFNQIPKHCNRLILIPHLYLHLFPLHALPIQETCLLELFPNGVSCAPSCQLLQLVQQRQREKFESIFAIQNPTEDLEFTDLEVNSILPLFSSHQVLPRNQATKTALYQAALQLQQANCIHFSCHGLFNLNSPLDSRLILASAENKEDLDLSNCLTLGNLFDRILELNQCHLVTLSACETGLIDFQNISDEYIGLPSGFIYAGTKSVVSSLWSVKDVSTALLMIRFYQNLKAGLKVAIALNHAQLWLRNATKEELQIWKNNLKLIPELVKQIDQELDWFYSGEQPYQNPVYWAAFCAIGQ